MNEGQRVDLVHGPQGGYHVWGAFRGYGFDPQNFALTFRLLDDALVVGRANYVDSIVGTASPIEYTAVTVILDEGVDPQQFTGQTLTLELELRSSDPLVLRDSVSLRPICCVEF